MKIGFDAKWLYTGNISGRLFIQNILPEMLALHPEIEGHIFLNRISQLWGGRIENLGFLRLCSFDHASIIGLAGNGLSNFAFQ